MKKRMNKKASHVGVVLSFVVFITFVIFLYSILEPSIRSQRDKESSLNQIKTELIKKTTSNLTTLTISLNQNHHFSCIKIPSIKDVLDKKKLIIKDKNSNLLGYEYSFNSFKIKSSLDFFKIFYSNKFPENSIAIESQCILINPQNYSIGQFKTSEYLFESEIVKYFNLQKDNYEGLSKNLNVPESVKFSFDITYSNTTTLQGYEGNLPSTDIYSKKIPIQYVDEQANIVSGFITIKVW